MVRDKPPDCFLGPDSSPRLGTLVLAKVKFGHTPLFDPKDPTLIALGLGVVLYFLADREPSPAAPLAGLALSALAALLLRHRRRAFRRLASESRTASRW